MVLKHAGQYFQSNRVLSPAAWMRPLIAAIWCAVAASSVYWAMQWFTVPRADPPPLAPQGESKPRTAGVSPLRAWFAATDARMPTLQVKGLIAAAPQRSTAILSVGGAAPKAFHVGQEIVPGATLAAVSASGVRLRLSDGSESFVAATPPVKVPGITELNP